MDELDEILGDEESTNERPPSTIPIAPRSMYNSSEMRSTSSLEFGSNGCSRSSSTTDFEDAVEELNGEYGGEYDDDLASDERARKGTRQRTMRREEGAVGYLQSRLRRVSVNDSSESHDDDGGYDDENDLGVRVVSTENKNVSPTRSHVSRSSHEDDDDDEGMMRSRGPRQNSQTTRTTASSGSTRSASPTNVTGRPSTWMKDLSAQLDTVSAQLNHRKRQEFGGPEGEQEIPSGMQPRENVQTTSKRFLPTDPVVTPNSTSSFHNMHSLRTRVPDEEGSLTAPELGREERTPNYRHGHDSDGGSTPPPVVLTQQVPSSGPVTVSPKKHKLFDKQQQQQHIIPHATSEPNIITTLPQTPTTSTEEESTMIDTILQQLSQVEHEYSTKLTNLEQTLSKKETIIEALSTQLSTLRTTTDQITQENQTQSTIISQLEDQLSLASGVVEELGGEMDRVREEHRRELEEEEKRRDEAVHRAEEELKREAERQFERANECFGELKEEYGRLKEEAEGLKDELKRERVMKEEAVRRREKRDLEAVAEMAQLKSELASAKAQVAANTRRHTSSMEALSSRETSLREEFQQVQDDCTAAHRSLAAVVAEKERLESSNKELEAMCEELMQIVEGQGGGDAEDGTKFIGTGQEGYVG